jgi:hypothetical protein
MQSAAQNLPTWKQFMNSANVVSIEHPVGVHRSVIAWMPSLPVQLTEFRIPSSNVHIDLETISRIEGKGDDAARRYRASAEVMAMILSVMNWAAKPAEVCPCRKLARMKMNPSFWSPASFSPMFSSWRHFGRI